MMTTDSQNTQCILWNLEKGLLHAAQVGGALEIQLLLNTGVNINIININGWSPLLIACKNNTSDTVKLLIESGADLNFADPSGTTALMIATRDQNFEIVDVLCGKRVNLDHQNSQGKTALMLAVQCGYVEIVELLLSNGADANLMALDAETALIMAASKLTFSNIQEKFLKIIEYLVHWNADVCHVDSRGATFLTYIPDSLREHVEDLIDSRSRLVGCLK